MSPDGPKTKLTRLTESVEKGEEVLIARFGSIPAHAARTQREARAVVVGHKEQRTGVVSLQVLQEYFVNATRKLGLDPGLVRQKVEIYSRFEVVEPVAVDILAAIDFHRLHRISYWDALVLHCAKKSGCRVVLSEDMPQGQVVDGVEIVNPFL
jgi:predicted nucleic acid-binding protein